MSAQDAVTPTLRLALTPAGTLHAYGREAPDETRLLLQSVLAMPTLPLAANWAARSEAHAELMARGRGEGWLHLVQRELRAPDVRLGEFLPHVVTSLSGDKRAALAAVGGFCLGHAGYSAAEAEALCVAAADFTEFARRQRARGWLGASDAVSFHQDVAMLIPSVSLVPFWVDGIDYCLVIGGEPLLNNPAFVELVWGIQAAGARFASMVRDVGKSGARP